MSHVYCAECGFQNPEAANYCSKCGALLAPGEPGETTLSISPEEIVEEAAELAEAVLGPALVVRAGGGRTGEILPLAAELVVIGRSPDCDVFLDDVTVSRRHAELRHDDELFTIRDLGSLNGTYVNRRRVEQVELEDDDEVQVGKYRMTFHR